MHRAPFNVKCCTAGEGRVPCPRHQARGWNAKHAARCRPQHASNLHTRSTRQPGRPRSPRSVPAAASATSLLTRRRSRQGLPCPLAAMNSLRACARWDGSGGGGAGRRGACRRGRVPKPSRSWPRCTVPLYCTTPQRRQHPLKQAGTHPPTYPPTWGPSRARGSSPQTCPWSAADCAPRASGAAALQAAAPRMPTPRRCRWGRPPRQRLRRRLLLLLLLLLQAPQLKAAPRQRRGPVSTHPPALQWPAPRPRHRRRRPAAPTPPFAAAAPAAARRGAAAGGAAASPLAKPPPSRRWCWPGRWCWLARRPAHPPGGSLTAGAARSGGCCP